MLSTMAYYLDLIELTTDIFYMESLFHSWYLIHLMMSVSVLIPIWCITSVHPWPAVPVNKLSCMLSDQYSERKHTCVDTTMALDLIPVLHQDFLQYLSEITDIFFCIVFETLGYYHIWTSDTKEEGFGIRWKITSTCFCFKFFRNLYLFNHNNLQVSVLL